LPHLNVEIDRCKSRLPRPVIDEILAARNHPGMVGAVQLALGDDLHDLG